MRMTLVAVFGLLLSGCASVAANGNGGVVEGVMSAKQGLAKADAACAKAGHSAKTTAYDGLTNTLTFECV